MSQIAHIEGSLPVLGALYIMPPIPSSPTTGDSFFTFRNAPSLRTVGGDINILGRCNLPWPQIKSVIYPRQLSVGERKNFSFLKRIQSSIEHWEMCASSMDTIPPNTMAITAPRLVSLEISTFGVTPSILGHLILPSLRSFSTSAGSQGVAALIERSKCPLQKLEIRATRSTLECQNLLTVMPTTLETLTSAVYGNRGYGANDLRKLMSATSHI